jgi:hypothetical protein
MIRPFTCLVFLLACGSGLYLYQSKHRVKMLDDQIAQIARSTDALRAQTRMLSAEWTLLNDPERLRQLASQFLTLQTVSPNQFTSLADLDSRLPPVVVPGPPPGTPADGGEPADGGVPPSASVPMASDDSSRAGANEGKPADAKVAEAPPPAAPKAASPPTSSASPPRIAMTVPQEPLHPAERKPATPRIVSAAAQPRFVASQARPPEPRAPDQRVFQPRFAEARSIAPVSRAPAPAPMPSAGGSLLGMAHGMGSPPAPIPLPRPMPMSAPSFSYTNGG